MSDSLDYQNCSRSGILITQQRCQLVRFICKPYRYLRFARAYGRTMQSLWIFMIFADSHLQSFHSLYSNCCKFAVTPSMLREAKHATAAYNREHKHQLSVSQQVVFCLLLYVGVLQRDHMPKLCFVMVLTSCKDFLQIVRIFCHDLTDMSCPRLTPLSHSFIAYLNII